MLRVLIVCLGNICRSPIGEELIRQHAKRSNLNILVDSAGTKGWHAGKAPDIRSQEVVQNHGFDISRQKSRAIKSNDFNAYEYILCMDEQNMRDLSNYDQGSAKISLFVKEQNVPDPYYGSEDGFEHVYNMLDRAAQLWIQKWLEK